MLVIVRSAPDTAEGKRGVKLARSLSALLVLVQNGVYFIQGQALEDLGFAGSVYVLEDDRRLRGIKADDTNKRMQDIGYDGFVDLMTGAHKVVGMF